MTADAEVLAGHPSSEASGRAPRADAGGIAAAPWRDETYRRDIDGLRAVAVLAVVVFHAFPGVLPGGFVGVDVFFVISGYLITGVIMRRVDAGRFSFADFYARRAKRILPALLVVLVACGAFGAFTLLPDEYRQLGKHIAAGMAFVSNFALWSEAGYFDASATAKPLLHLWSLGIEEQFYLVWPLALWWCRRGRRRALWLIGVIGALSFAINLATVHRAPVAAFYSPLSRFWELQLGCLLAFLMRSWTPNPVALTRRTADALSIVGAILLALSIACLKAKFRYPGWYALVPTVGAFLLIAAGPHGWFCRNVLSRPALVGIGLISYPLYLWHWPLLSFAWIAELGATPPVAVRAVLALASIILALATYVFVEKPIRFGAKRRFKVPALAAGAIFVGLMGLIIFERDGVPERFPPEVRELADFKVEYQTDARYPDCWVPRERAFDGFAPSCAVTSGPNLAVLWGDSHAARLYPGLAAVFGRSMGLSQFTRDACPPILGVAGDNCQKSNAWIVGEIARIHPRTVILDAAWTHHRADWVSPSVVKTAMLATIDALRAAGVEKIVVVGPAPVWTGGLPKLAYRAWLASTPFHTVPERLAAGFDATVAIEDAAMRRELMARHVVYFSANDAFCTKQGCLTHVPSGETRLVTWDSGHLTTDGATFLARRIADAGVLP